MLRRGLALRSPALAPRATRLLSSRFAPKPVPPGSAYAVLGVGRDIDDDSLRRAYKELAKEWQAEQDSGWLRAVHEAHPQQVLSAGESLEKVSSSLGAEEARWRAGTAALQQQWQDEARAMMARWQAVWPRMVEK